MKNAWLIRPFPNGIARLKEFKENGIIAVGWPGIGDLKGKSREDLKAILADVPYSLTGLALGNAYATVDIFVNQMKAGDLLLMPNGDDIYLGEVTSDYYFDFKVDTDEEGYSHQRTAKWLACVSRQDLSMALRSSLKVHRTTANLSLHSDEINALCKGEKPILVPDFIEVKYPLRPDFEVSFKIPKDINSDEAKRLSFFLASLYFTKQVQ